MTEWLLRAIGLLAYGFAVLNLARAWFVDPSRSTLLMLLVIEGYTLILMLVARRALSRDMSPAAILATIYAAFFFVLLNPRGTTHLLPELAGLVLQTAGLAWQVAAKVTLGRSFGLLPAQRQLVFRGPYRFVRHPIYFGYLLSDVAFMLANFSWINFTVLFFLYVAQVVRVQREERLLSRDPDYRDYMAVVRWRLVPGMY